MPEEFDEISYLLRYPDVLAAVRGGAYNSGYDHWLALGSGEGRCGLPEAWPLADGFDEQRYLRNNPDVEAAVRAGVFSSGRQHWDVAGRGEKRQGADQAWMTQHSGVGVDPALPFGVNHFGFHSAVRGLGVAARGYVDALHSLGIPVHVVDVPLWDTASAELHSSETAPFRINLIHQNADSMALWASRYPGAQVNRFNIGLWVWELHAGYANMHAASRLLHEIWVPSQFVHDSIRSISAVPVFRIPYVIAGDVAPAHLGRDHFGIPENSWVFLFVFDLASGFNRKNPLALLQAFQKVFQKNDRATLVLKFLQVGHDRRTADLIEALAARYPNVTVFPDPFSEAEMAALYQVSDCFVSPHRSEGFGLGIAQAMYYGKPAIATGYSGNMDFMRADDGYLIDYRLTPVGPNNPPYLPDYVWAEPDIDHLAYLMQHVAFHQEEARARGQAAATRIRRDFSESAVSKMILERLQMTGAAPELIP